MQMTLARWLRRFRGLSMSALSASTLRMAAAMPQGGGGTDSWRAVRCSAVYQRPYRRLCARLGSGGTKGGRGTGARTWIPLRRRGWPVCAGFGQCQGNECNRPTQRPAVERDRLARSSIAGCLGGVLCAPCQRRFVVAANAVDTHRTTGPRIPARECACANDGGRNTLRGSQRDVLTHQNFLEVALTMRSW